MAVFRLLACLPDHQVDRFLVAADYTSFELLPAIQAYKRLKKLDLTVTLFIREHGEDWRILRTTITPTIAAPPLSTPKPPSLSTPKPPSPRPALRSVASEGPNP